MDFRPRIKEFCKERKILQKDLAEKLGITPIGLSQTLGQNYPQLQTLERIAKALDVEVVELFDPPATVSAGANVVCPKCGTALKLNAEIAES